MKGTPEQTKITAGLEEAVEAILLGDDTSSSIGARIGVSKEAAYQRLYCLRKAGMVEMSKEKIYTLIHSNYWVEVEVIETPEFSVITELTAQVLDAVKAGLDSTTVIERNTELARSTISHGLTQLYKRGLVTREDKMKGKVKTHGFVYKYSGKEYDVGLRRGGRCQEIKKNVTYEACDRLIWRAVA